MTACSYCSARKGKRACPALGGEICPSCCGKHRLVDIECPADCRWLGGLAVVRDQGVAGFTRQEYLAACDQLIAYVGSPRGRAAQPDVLAKLTDDPRNLPDWMSSVVVAYVGFAHRGQDGLRAVDRYLAAYGRALSTGEVAALMALQQAWPSLFEVTSVRAGAGFTARDLLVGDELEVRELTASMVLRPGDVVFAWMMRAGDAMEMTGDPIRVPRGKVDEVRRRMTAELSRSWAAQPEVPARRLLGDLADVALVALRDSLAAPPRPQLQTTHGEALLLCEAHYAVDDAAAVRAELRTFPLLAEDGDNFVWLARPLGAKPGKSPTVLGRVRIGANRLVLETMSRERLTAGREMLEEVLGALIVHRADAIADPEVPLHQEGGRETSSSPVPDDVQAELVAKVITEHYRRWLDEPVPALKGRTPRKVAASKKGREQVAALLDDFERDSHGQPGTGPALWNELRRELGIPERR